MAVDNSAEPGSPDNAAPTLGSPVGTPSDHGASNSGPATASADPAAPTSVSSWVFRAGKLVHQDVSRERLDKYLKDPSTVVLIDFTSPSRDDLSWVVERLHLHPVAVTDILERSSRPKLERYDTHDFLYCYYLDFDKESGYLHAADVAFFFAGNAVVSVRQPGSEDFFKRLAKRVGSHADLSAHGMYALFWGVLDAVVDSHFDVVQEMDDHLDDLEENVFQEDRAMDVPETQRQLFAARKDLVRIRRLTFPMREIVNAVVRDERDRIPSAMLPYFNDVYDHTLRVNDWVDSSRDLLTSLLDASLTIQGNRMNLIMKKVTSWAAIIAVPTLITGFFGQNIPFIGFGEDTGLILSSGLIVVSSVTLYALFRKNDWL